MVRFSKPNARRRGVSAVELAILLPILVFLFVIGVDFARVYYFQLTLTNSSRAGAVYGSSDPVKAVDSDGIKKLALADATNLTPAPEISSETFTGSDGHPYVSVTSTWTFSTVTRFPGVPNTMVLSRTVKMRIAPKTPKDEI